ncbi:MAG: cobaltochelatase subunit CobN [Candidatus Puniceispirillales bacterium]
MHLLRIEQSGDLYQDGEAVDLGQSPGRLVFLSAADTEISMLAAAVDASGRDGQAVRLANYMNLNHPYSVDLYCENTLSHARVIVVRLLGGASYWPYGVEQIAALARKKGVPLAFLAGDGKPDPELDAASTMAADDLERLNACLIAGGMENALAFLDHCDDLIDGTAKAALPKPLPPAGLYWPGEAAADLAMIGRFWRQAGIAEDAPVAAVVFYRALTQSGDTAPVDGLISALLESGMAPLPVFVASLKDPFSADLVTSLFAETPPRVILNLTSFAVSDPAGQRKADHSPGPFAGVDAPVIQAMLASGTRSTWADGMAGLNPRDLAMHVVLPELDGRISSRVIGFKSPPRRHQRTEAMVTGYDADHERCRFTAALAAAWSRLARTPRPDRRLALIMANYPNKDSRLANGVGLDTPESAAVVMQHLAAAGYDAANAPADSAAVIKALLAVPTNSGLDRADEEGRVVEVTLPFDRYHQHYRHLPESLRQQVEERWGSPEADPMRFGEGLALPLRRFGNIILAVQPARGYQIDPKASYHSPDLPPPHHYLAFYFWLRHEFGAHAVIHLGKHGNLEWLPGKALALSPSCFPDAILGPMPHFYPFIVNDPGEGSQAKRRTAAVILDHLTPPMTLAESHGIMAELETLMDEYYEAAGMDARRSSDLVSRIIETAARAGIAADCGIADTDPDDEKLLKLDNFLCDLKEMQIRDGLHIYGRSPEGRLRDDLITAILRIPRGDGEGARQSILRSLARDLGLDGFDPLAADAAAAWTGPTPPLLADIDPTPWRHQGDTVERLGLVAAGLVSGQIKADPAWAETGAVLAESLPAVSSAIDACGGDELRFLLKGLDGGYVPAAPAGAPTRGRPETLPTGRNFFSIDSRAVPTEAAWRIGFASATLLIERFVQDQGNYPKALVLSAWGTANMRTGGDDIAQALALMGVQPKWDGASRRVTGFEIMPVSVLGRPRVDVTLRCSGFFRDAFPAQIALVDKVARAVGDLDEPEDQNPIAARMKAETAAMEAEGMSPDEARLKAGFRVYSARPGAYGAGLQTLIDEGIWQDRSDFADAFLTWSSYAYGDKTEGMEARSGLEQRLGAVDAVIHNQDNREHDILDSDDYYQFAGGLAASVAAIKGRDAPVYMNDHSLAEKPVIRSLGEEISRVVRGRATNPKWLSGVMRHGYKGAFEIAATLDYLFAFAATTRQVPGHLFDAVHEAWIENEEVRTFIETANPHALDDMLDRFNEAIERGLWQPRRNSVIETLAQPRQTGQNARERKSYHDDRTGRD